MKKIPEELLPVVEWWEQHGKKAIVVGVIALIAGIAYWAWDVHQERAREASAQSLSAALASWAQCMRDPNSVEAAEAIQSLQDTVATAGGKGASIAKLILANAYCRRGSAEEKDYENALAIYDALAASGEDLGVYGEIPALGRAQCLEATGKFKESLAAFDEFVAANPGAYQALAAQLGAARSLAQDGRKQEAVARLEKLMKEKDGEAVIARAQPVEQQLNMYRQLLSYFAQQKNGLAQARKYEAEIVKLQNKLRPDEEALADAKAIRYTLDLVKRWTADRPAVEPPAPQPVAEPTSPAAEKPAEPAAEKPAEPAPAESPAAPAEPVEAK